MRVINAGLRPEIKVKQNILPSLPKNHLMGGFSQSTLIASLTLRKTALADSARGGQEPGKPASFWPVLSVFFAKC